MRGYGQFCPVAKAAEILTERWTPLVIRELMCGSRRFWWLLSDHDAVDLCATEPGVDVDLRVRGALESLTGVWMGDRALAAELDAGRLELHGPEHLRRRFPEWLALSTFANVRPPRAAAGR